MNKDLENKIKTELSKHIIIAQNKETLCLQKVISWSTIVEVLKTID